MIKANQINQELIKSSGMQKNKLFEYETHCKLKDDEFEKILEQNTELMEMKDKEINRNNILLSFFKQSLNNITSKLHNKNNGEEENLDKLFSLYNSDNQSFKESINSITNNINNKVLNLAIDSFIKENLKISCINKRIQSEYNIINSLLQENQVFNLDFIN